MTIKLLAGDCRDVLPTLAADSVHCVVTSPPYYGLRDYGTALWDGGDAACDHREVQAQNRPGRETPGGRGGTFPTSERGYRDTCGKCGAVRIDRQIGLESSPSEYLATMVAVFREVRRVLHPTGTVFCNMGDGYRDKQLLLMPARLALALQQDGWFIRSQMPWVKRSAMPESATDRPASAVEYVFMLTKGPRYFWDQEAVKRSASDNTNARFGPEGHRALGTPKEQRPGGGVKNNHSFQAAIGEVLSSRNFRNSDLFFDSLEAPHGMICGSDGVPLAMDVNPAGFAGAHFATFPSRLIEPLIRAGTSERGCCAACGAPWRRIVERTCMVIDRSERTHPMGRTRTSGTMLEPPTAVTTGWAPGCDHGAEVVPCTVLDPFCGAGTTLLCSDRLQRDAIGIELNVAYTEMAMERCRADAPLFTSFPPAEPPEDERIADLFQDMAAE